LIGDKPYILRVGRFRLKIWKSDYGKSKTSIEFEYNQFDKRLNKWVPFRVRIFVEDIDKLKKLVDLFYSRIDELKERGFL